ncbi:metal-sensitive transcriptional regulator [Brevibacterium samyangense]|uniref:Metal-sensitive transcriptional regulator n=1 Tax=Brevibacterium samyangense TaxID=366888 RepID=A0ABN2TBF7_9MICO
MDVDPSDLRSAINRLKRANGQISAVIRMIEEGEDCASIITQLSAANTAVERAGVSVLTQTMKKCMADGSDEVDLAQLEKVFLSLT